jgi:hypothetical protein
MINDAGKHHVNASNEPVSLRAGLWPGLPCRSGARRTRGPNGRSRTLSGHRYPEIIFPHHARVADPTYLDAINRARQVMA